MTPLVKTIVALNLVSGVAQLAQIGVLYPAVALWLDARGLAAWQVGLVGSCFWAGVLTGNLFTPRWAHAYGAAFVVTLGCAVSGFAAVGGAGLGSANIALWCVLSALIGLGSGMRWIGNESWLYNITPGAQRGRVVGVHEMLIGAGQAGGTAIIAAVGVLTASAIFIGGSIAILLPLLLLFTAIRAPQESTTPPAPIAVLKGMFKHARSSGGIQLGLLSGLTDGVLYGMLVIYLVKSGETAANAALMFSVFGLGSLFASLPCGALSDKRGVRFTTFISVAAGVIGALLLFAQVHWLDWVACFLLGALTGNLLTLAIIVGTERAAAEGTHMSVALSEVSIAFTVATIAGPLLAGAAMDSLGLWALPAMTIAMCSFALLLRLPARAATIPKTEALNP
jgi:MFS family permease